MNSRLQNTPEAIAQVKEFNNDENEIHCPLRSCLSRRGGRYEYHSASSWTRQQQRYQQYR
jgi:hypothetical protein